MTVLRHAVVASVTAALWTACATAQPPAASGPGGNQQVTLAKGQTSTVDNGLRLRFDRVKNDSRCPADVACIQAGEAVVAITVTAADRSSRTYELHTIGATSVVHDGLTISLEKLEPQPVSSRPVRPADYRLTLRVGM